jgi:hypothetical protein
MEQQPRIDERISLANVKVCMHTSTGKISDCELLDVSPGGARLRLPQGESRRKGGEKVTLQISNLPLGGLFNNKQALIIWADRQQLGMRLLDPLALPEEDMRRLLKFNLAESAGEE